MLPDKDVFQALCDFDFARREAVLPSVDVVFQVFPPQTVSEDVLGDSRYWYLTTGDSEVF